MAEDGVYMDIDAVQGIANILGGTGALFKNVNQGLSIAIETLEFAALTGIIGAGALKWYLEGIQPHVDKLAVTMEELCRDVSAAIRSYRDGDTSGAKRFQSGDIYGTVVKGPWGKTYEAFVRGRGDLHAIDPSDIDQGNIGTCYLLSPLASAAINNPGLIENMIHDNGDGTFTVYFYDPDGKGGYTRVGETVDTNFPGWFGNPEYAQPGDTRRMGSQEIWPMLIEKAYAQHHKGWKKIDFGNPGKAMEELTGVPSTSAATGSMTIDQFADHHSKGHLMVVGSHQTRDTAMYKNGTIAPQHAYYVESVDPVNNIVNLRNPWGWNEPVISMTYEEYQKQFAQIIINPMAN